MKFKLLTHIAILALMMTLSNSTVSAQKFDKPIRGLGNMNIEITPIGFIDDHEIFSFTTVNTFGGLNYRLYSYKDKKKVAQKEMVLDFNGKKYVPDNFFIKENRLYSYFLAEDQQGKSTGLYFQEFSTSFEQKGQPQFIVDLPNALDGSKFKAKYGHFLGNPTSYQSLDVKLNEDSGEIIVVFSVKYEGKDQKTSYAKIVNVDKDLKPVATRTYKAKNPSDIVKVNIIGMYPNHDAFAYVSVGQETTTKGTKQFNITSHNILYIPGNGDEIEELEIEGGAGNLKNMVATESLNEKGIYHFAVHTAKNNNTLGTINLFEYNPSTNQLNKKNITIDGSVKIPTNLSKNQFRLNNLYSLDNGGVICDIHGKNEGSIAMSINEKGDVVWSKMVRPQIICSGFVNGTYSTIVGNEMKLIFNMHPSALSGSKLNTEKPMVVTFKSKPMIATINLEDGSTKYKFMDSKSGSVDGAICYTLSKKLAPGKFMLRMKYNGMVQNVPVTFEQ